MNDSDTLCKAFTSDQILPDTLSLLRKIVFESSDTYQLVIDAGSVVNLSDEGKVLIANCENNPRLSLIFGTEKGWIFVRAKQIRSAFAANPAISNAQELAEQLVKLGYQVGYLKVSPFDRASFRIK